MCLLSSERFPQSYCEVRNALERGLECSRWTKLKIKRDWMRGRDLRTNIQNDGPRDTKVTSDSCLVLTLRDSFLVE